jgi:alpha-aminoadipic semialdehyde synthase
MLIGIRREDKNRWERRVPLTPEDLAELAAGGLAFRAQPSPIRIFPDEAYRRAGAEVAEDLGACDLILGVKEIPSELLLPRKSYLYFSHVIKCQPYNMPMMKRLLELGCTLYDYELIADEQGRRLVFFGRHAGLAGMIDTLHALGARLAAGGLENPFAAIRMAHEYDGLAAAGAALDEVGARIRAEGLPAALRPLVVGFAGYGHVSQGAQEILAHLPLTTITPAELPRLRADDPAARDHLYQVVFKEEDLVAPRDAAQPFVLQDYYDHPEKYRSRFAEHLPHLSVLVNCIYWTPRYPRLVTRDWVAANYRPDAQPRLRVIGDISCDIEGSIEITLKATDPAAPCYVYDPASGEIRDGVRGPGPVVMAVDNLPCELPRESSEHFSHALRGFLAALRDVDLQAPFESLVLPDPLRRAAIAVEGRLRPDFGYIADCIEKL